MLWVPTHLKSTVMFRIQLLLPVFLHLEHHSLSSFPSYPSYGKTTKVMCNKSPCTSTVRIFFLIFLHLRTVSTKKWCEVCWMLYHLLSVSSDEKYLEFVASDLECFCVIINSNIWTIYNNLGRSSKINSYPYRPGKLIFPSLLCIFNYLSSIFTPQSVFTPQFLLFMYSLLSLLVMSSPLSSHKWLRWSESYQWFLHINRAGIIIYCYIC